MLKTDGTIWTVGYGEEGQLGNGGTSNESSPVQVGSSTDWSDIVRGNSMSFGMRGDALFAWGRNNHQGQLGDGTLTNRSSPVQIGSDAWIKLPEQLTSSWQGMAIK